MKVTRPVEVALSSLSIAGPHNAIVNQTITVTVTAFRASGVPATGLTVPVAVRLRCVPQH